MIRWVSIAAALLVPALAHAQAAKVGDTFLITRMHTSESKSNDGSQSSSSGSDALQERVVAVRDDGLELEYDLTADAGPEERAIEWHFPARIFRPAHGTPRLLNAPELEARVDPWLQRGGMTRAACGHWIFTWNAFMIDCDPQSVLKAAELYDLHADLREGAPMRHRLAHGTAPLVKAGTRFTVELPVDPEAVLNDRIDSDLMVAEVSGRKMTRDEARRGHAGETVSGTITIRFDTDGEAVVRKRTTTIRLETRGPGDKVEIETSTDMFERRPIADPAKQRRPGEDWT